MGNGLWGNGKRGRVAVGRSAFPIPHSLTKEMRHRELLEMYELEDTYWWFVARRRMVRSLVQRYAAKSEGLKILDAGCGTGGTLSALEGLGELWGCDISADALELCGTRGLTQLRECGVEQLDFEDESFDVVVSCDVLEHVAEHETAMAEMARVLRPGGVCVLTVPAHRCLWSEHDEALGHIRRYGTREFVQLVEGGGLRIEKLTHAVALALPAIILYRAMKRLLVPSDGRPKTALVRLPGPINNLLDAFLHFENLLIRHISLPIGTSLVAVARKPEGSRRPEATQQEQ